MDPTQTAVLLATPAGVAVVGALLWWRVGQVEKEVTKLRETKHETANDVAKMQGSVETMRDTMTQLLQAVVNR